MDVMPHGESQPLTQSDEHITHPCFAILIE